MFAHYAMSAAEAQNPAHRATQSVKIGYNRAINQRGLRPQSNGCGGNPNELRRKRITVEHSLIPSFVGEKCSQENEKPATE